MIVRKLTENDYFLSLEPGEKVVATLKKWAEDNNIEAGVISGIGGTGDIEHGATSMEAYIKSTANKFPVYELTTVTGNITKIYEDGSTKVHIHATWVDNDFNACGGHIFEMETKIVVEVHVRVFPGKRLVRRQSTKIQHKGAKVISESEELL